MNTVYTEIRLLLNLWDMGSGQGKVKKSELLRRTCKGKEKAAIYQERLQELEAAEAIAVTTEKKSVIMVALTDVGLQKLATGLLADDFVFDGQLVGSRLANAGLRWFRQNQGQVGGLSVESAPKISSYDKFKAVALETYDQLNRDYNFDNLVPIYRIRRAIDERVTRSQFNDWMLEMQSNDVFLLQDGTIEDGASDKLRDSV